MLHIHLPHAPVCLNFTLGSCSTARTRSRSDSPLGTLLLKSFLLQHGDPGMTALHFRDLVIESCSICQSSLQHILPYLGKTLYRTAMLPFEYALFPNCKVLLWWTYEIGDVKSQKCHWFQMLEVPVFKMTPPTSSPLFCLFSLISIPDALEMLETTTWTKDQANREPPCVSFSSFPELSSLCYLGCSWTSHSPP